METNKHSVLSEGRGPNGLRTVELTASTITADGFAGSAEKTTIKISDNPYYYGDMIQFSTDGPVTLAIPLPRFMRHLNDIYGYDALKRYVDGLPQELRKDTQGGDR